MIRSVIVCAVILSAAVATDIAAAAPAGIDTSSPGHGPTTQSRSRIRRHRRSTVRLTHRTPEVMREDAARVKRGDLFSTWSSAAGNTTESGAARVSGGTAGSGR